MSSSFLSNLPHKLDYDPREPIFSTRIMDKVIGFYSIDLFFFHACLGYVVVQVMCVALTSILVYKFCVVKKKEKTDDNDSDKKKKRHGVSPTMSSIIVGYCIVIPTWAIAPYYIFETYDFKNTFLRFVLSAVVPVVTIFRTTAAVHGFVPEQTTKSWSSFVFYYALPLISLYDKEKQQYVKSTTLRKIQLFKAFFTLNIVAGLIISIYASNYFPLLFPKIGTHQSYDDWYPPSSRFFKDWLMSPWNAYINLLIGCFYSIYMTMIASGLQLVQEILFGIKTVDVMDSPFRTAKTPADFWAGKWNVLIHDGLKNGVYKPVRAMPGGSNLLGVFMTFFMSSVFHEWMLLVMFPLHGKYQPLRGFTLIYFLLHGVWVAIDMAVTRKSKFLQNNREVVKWVWAYIFASNFHWFAAPYADSNIFPYGAPMHFLIKEVVPVLV